jgi:hypothetical protein
MKAGFMREMCDMYVGWNHVWHLHSEAASLTSASKDWKV